MRSCSFWFLTAFLVFATLALGEAVKGGKEKWGNCPAEKGSCIKSGPSQCHADNDCPGDKKCCFLNCSFKCVSPDRIRKEGKEPLHTRPGALTSPASIWPMKARRN
uniref:WAP domain-containing protein n=1 Tax=Prolemur simus TaxID=1328070 RepID=A0A8C8ZXR9_PROSS